MSRTNHPDSEPPSRNRIRDRPRLRNAAVVLGLAIVAGIPILVRGQEAGDKPVATGAKANADKSASSTPARAATQSGAPGAKPDAVPEKAAQGRATAPRTTTERISGFGAKTIEVTTFECRPVRNDEDAQAEQFPVPMPPFSPAVFPCTGCHDRPDDYNLEKRNLTIDHTNIKLAHGPREQWCYGCHNPTDRDQLRLAGGRLIGFDKSYELCGQCHGPKFRDWRLGIHGQRTGCWNGKREYRLCVHCHNPHAPKFPPIAPMPRPPRPGEMH